MISIMIIERGEGLGCECCTMAKAFESRAIL